MIRVKFGEKYTGPGCADPRLTRDQREAQLRSFMGTDDGRSVVHVLYHEAKGIPFGTMIPIGTLFSSMVEEILNHEYPVKA
jgi:hypothetical protein